MDKHHFSQAIEPLEGVLAHGFDVGRLESKNDKVRTARFVLDGLHRTGVVGDVLDVLLRDGQAPLHDACAQGLLLFCILSVVEEKHADARVAPVGVPLQDVGEQNHQAGIHVVFRRDPQMDVVFVAKLPAAAPQQRQVQPRRRQQPKVVHELVAVGRLVRRVFHQEQVVPFA